MTAHTAVRCAAPGGRQPMADSHHTHMKVNLSALEDRNAAAWFAHLIREAGGSALVEDIPDVGGIVTFMTYPCDCEQATPAP